jgi:hypothetical protein
MTDIVERLRRWLPEESTYELLEVAADEIERLRKALKIFADNVKDTNVGIDENWAKTVYPLKAENQRLRAVMETVADALHDKGDYECWAALRNALCQEGKQSNAN